MTGSASKRGWVALVLLSCTLVAALPAGAQYTKLYVIPNTTGSSQSWIQATLYGFEIINATYADPVAWSGYPGYTLYGGIYATTVGYADDGVVGLGDSLTIGWTTADYSCYTLDLRWGTGVGAIPGEYYGVPGGGELIDNGDGTYTWRFCNKGDNDILLGDVQLASSSEPLDWAALSAAATEGVTAQLATEIDLAILDLRDAVKKSSVPWWVRGVLVRKLDNAAWCKERGLEAFEEGYECLARIWWTAAIWNMRCFVANVKTFRRWGKIPGPLAHEWIVAAHDIIEQLKHLRDARSLSGSDDSEPVAPDVLPPGECFEVTISGVGPGDALILSGSVPLGPSDRDAVAQALVLPQEPPVLTWVEQVVVGGAEEMTPDTTPPTILVDETNTPIQIPVEYFGDGMVEVDLEGVVSASDDNGSAEWYVKDVAVTYGEGGHWETSDEDPHYLRVFAGEWQPTVIGDSATTDATGALTGDVSGAITIEPSRMIREYDVTIEAIDMAGNTATAHVLVQIVRRGDVPLGAVTP
ncbi:MAG: hypothetical protein ACE5O2_05740 [Armatimonadota bacterium]